MKKLSFIYMALALVLLSGCAGGMKPIDRSKTIGQEKQSIAERSSKTKAQQTISAVGVPATLGAYRTANNAELAKVEANMGELYTLKADKSCFATESAFNACFDLTWNTGGTTYTAGTGISITEGVIASTITDTDTFSSWDKDYTDLINKPTIPTISDAAYGVGWNGDAGAASKNAIYDKIETIAGGTMTYPGAGVPVSTGSAWGTSLAASSFLVGDCTVGPCLDGTSDGGTILRLYGPNGFWQALQAGASTANRSWRLMIGAPPAAGTTTLLNVDEYGQMGQVATSTYLTPSGVGGALTFTASGFNGNLLTTDNTLQELADAVDNLDLSSSFDPASPGAIGSTTPAAITGTTITGSLFTSSSADGTHYLDVANGVAISSTPTLGLISYYNGRMRLADGTDWDGYFLEDTDLGSGVGAMLAIAPGSAGGPTTTIASGTSALGTGAISSGACASVVTTTATNTATTDVINWGFNGSPAAVTGYVASANGMLTIIAYPSSGNVNFLVCNNTAASITPGAVTLNWRVQR